MASNMFKLYKNEFRGLSTKQIYTKMREITILLCELFEEVELGGSLGGQILFVAANIGISGDGILTENEKELIDVVFEGIVKGPKDVLYDMLVEPIKDNTYDIIKKIIDIRHSGVNNLLLLFIIGFAIIDGKIEEDIEKKLDSIYGIHFLGEFFKSGLESVPVVEEDVEIDELESKILEYIKPDTGYPFNKICKKFKEYSEEELKDALDNLCEKGILYGGEQFFDCTYFLAN